LKNFHYASISIDGITALLNSTVRNPLEATLALIERVRRTLPRQSNYAVAKALDMEQGQLTRVLKGEFGLGAKAQLRISEILQMDLRDVLVLTEEDKAKRPEDREFWGRRSPRISAATAIAAVAFFAAGLGQDVKASTVYKTSCNWTSYTLCELRRLALTFLKSLFPRPLTV
jgi:hypothetical protein